MRNEVSFVEKKHIRQTFGEYKPDAILSKGAGGGGRDRKDRLLSPGPRIKIKREFDPGSESTLAARLTHASRARTGEQSSKYSGARVSNTWIIYLRVGNNPGKPGLRPHTPEKGKPQGAGRGVRGRLASW